MTTSGKKKISFDRARQLVLLFILLGICLLWTVMTPNFLHSIISLM